MTVTGYIHELESQYNQEIPEGIILVCTLFYGHETDELDPKCIGEDITLAGRTISVDQGNENAFPLYLGSAFGKKIVATGTFSWEFRIESIRARIYPYQPKPVIGIWNIESDDVLPPTNTWFCDGVTTDAYGFELTENTLTDIATGCLMDDKYGKKCEKGTIIEMIIDLVDLSLKYMIDDVDYGKAFDIVNQKYRAVVFICDGDSITML